MIQVSTAQLGVWGVRGWFEQYLVEFVVFGVDGSKWVLTKLYY